MPVVSRYLTGGVERFDSSFIGLWRKQEEKKEEEKGFGGLEYWYLFEGCTENEVYGWQLLSQTCSLILIVQTKHWHYLDSEAADPRRMSSHLY